MSMLLDGIHIVIRFPGAGLLFREVGLKPPGGDAGGPIDTTDLRNLVVRTRHPKTLKTLTALTGRCKYDPEFITTCFTQLGVNQIVQVDFPIDGVIKRLNFWGFLDKFDPQEVTEGSLPLANFTIEPSNEDANLDEVLPWIDTVLS